MLAKIRKKLINACSTFRGSPLYYRVFLRTPPPVKHTVELIQKLICLGIYWPELRMELERLGPIVFLY